MCIRVKSLAWIKHEDRLLVVEFFDIVKRDHYYRAPGGTVEFGELTLETLHRELHEELGGVVQVCGDPLILENLFTCNGEPGHEIVYLYPCQFTDQTLYTKNDLELTEANGEILPVRWINLQDCLDDRFRLVPEGLIKWYRNRYT